MCTLMVTFALYFSSCAMKEETDITFQQDIFDGLANIREYYGRIICECDIDFDGQKEIINIDYAEALLSSEDPISMTIADSDSQDIIWQEHALALPVAGWKQYYVVEIDETVYLMRFYEPKERQGEYYYCCTIFYLDSAGNEVTFYEIKGYTEEGIESFVSATSGYLNSAYLLISTMNGNLKSANNILKRN